MIAPQPPPLPIIISTQSVPGRDVPSQHLPPVAAIETNHIVPVDGPSHRNGGNKNLVWLGRLSKLNDRPLHRGNQIPQLNGPPTMGAHITLDPFSRLVG